MQTAEESNSALIFSQNERSVLEVVSQIVLLLLNLGFATGLVFGR